MKAYEIITEGPLDKLGKLSKVFRKEQPPRVEPKLGNIGGAVSDELSAAKQWYNSQKTKPQVDSGIKDQFGRPIKRDMTDDEILDAYKQSDQYKKAQAPEPAKTAAAETGKITGSPKTPNELPKDSFLYKWLFGPIIKFLGYTASTLLWTALIAYGVLNDFFKYSNTVASIKANPNLSDVDKERAIYQARGQLVASIPSSIATAGLAKAVPMLVGFLLIAKAPQKTQSILQLVNYWTGPGAYILQQRIGENTQVYVDFSEKALTFISEKLWMEEGQGENFTTLGHLFSLSFLSNVMFLAAEGEPIEISLWSKATGQQMKAKTASERGV